MNTQELNYYDFAEDDYQMLKTLVENKQIRNGMCSLAQSICERYLKQLVVNYIKQTDENILEYQSILRTHNVKRLLNYLTANLKDFHPDSKIKDSNGYYFSTRYPGEDSFMVNQDDINICWESVKACKKTVDDYIASKKPENQNGQIQTGA